MLSSFADEMKKIARVGRAKRALERDSNKLVPVPEILDRLRRQDERRGDTKLAFAVSSFSGPLSMGRFKQESSQPGRNTAEPLKVAEFGEYCGDHELAEGTRFKQESAQPARRRPHLKVASSAITPAGRLASAKSVGLPKVTTPPGPSIAQQVKPIGFGKPLPGATKV